MARDLTSEVVVVPPERWPTVVAHRIGARLEAALRTRGRATIALAGGETPRPAYRCLAGITLPWERIDVFFGDERAVAAGDAAANYRMAAETLLDPAGVPPERRHRMPADDQDRERAAREYAALLPDRLDVLLLGIGVDGHTASLFPHSPALDERGRMVVPAEAPLPPTGRLTVTPPVLEAARARLVLAQGEAKAAAVARALEGTMNVAACPAQLARNAVWLLDPAAASHLSEAGK